MGQKKVIFVQGTAYSGSTLFHMMLANDPHGFACGEVHGLFRPHKVSHINRTCTCGHDQCPVWPAILPYGERDLYAGIFEQLPEVDFIVDSSKQHFWIRSQNENLRRQGIPFYNLLIWKTPLEFAHSKKKRNQNDWERVWVNSHRLYLSYIPGVRTIRYQDLVQDPTVLPAVCNFLDIPYFEGKERYWEKKHCVLGGNKGTKAHLYEKSQATQLLQATTAASGGIAYQTIRYNPITTGEIIQEVKAAAEKDAYLEQLERLLTYADVSNEDFSPSKFKQMVADVRIPSPGILLRRIKYRGRVLRGQIRYRSAPRFAP